MAKVLIVSDNHGATYTLKNIIKRDGPFDLMIHCGDNELDGGLSELMALADCPVYAVSGNCDYFSDLSSSVHFDYKGHHILVTHGHRENVNYDLGTLMNKAALTNSDIVFFGHTHVPMKKEVGGIIFANPGSTDRPRQAGKEPTYMIMNIDETMEADDKSDKKVEIELKKYLY